MRHFKRSEFACGCGCGFQTVDYELAEILDDVREHFGQPTRITSGCRCPSYNKRVGGAPDSEHQRGAAADIKIDNVPAIEVYEYLNKKYTGRLGLGSYKTWVHLDVRERYARWKK